MKSLTLAAGAAALIITSPAWATLQIAIDIGVTTFTCVDNAACDLDPATGVLELADQTLGGLTVNGSISASGKGPGAEFLNIGSLSIVNSTALPVVATATVSDTGFSAPVTSIRVSGSGVWQSAAGSSIALAWSADAANTQGATFPGDLPGTLLDTFSDTAAGAADSFSHNGLAAFIADAPFSMTESASGVLVAGGALINRGQVMEATVPEPSTWALALTGFAALALMGLKRLRAA
jgi:hypothetical protein